MIYNYESKIIDYFKEIITNLKLASYANDDIMFGSLSSVKYFPAFYYHIKQNYEAPQMQIFEIVDGGKSQKMMKTKVEYDGYILCESLKEAYSLLQTLQFKTRKNPYIWIEYKGYKIKILLNFLNFDIKIIQYANNKDGGIACVQTSWRSFVPIIEGTQSDVINVSKINLYVDSQHSGVIIGSDGKIKNEKIKTIQ